MKPKLMIEEYDWDECRHVERPERSDERTKRNARSRRHDLAARKRSLSSRINSEMWSHVALALKYGVDPVHVDIIIETSRYSETCRLTCRAGVLQRDCGKHDDPEANNDNTLLMGWLKGTKRRKREIPPDVIIRNGIAEWLNMPSKLVPILKPGDPDRR